MTGTPRPVFRLALYVMQYSKRIPGGDIVVFDNGHYEFTPLNVNGEVEFDRRGKLPGSVIKRISSDADAVISFWPLVDGLPTYDYDLDMSYKAIPDVALDVERAVIRKPSRPR